MAYRITTAMVEKRIDYLNDLFGQSRSPYKRDAEGNVLRCKNGHLIVNPGTFLLSNSNRRYALARMCKQTHGGGSGEADVLRLGYMPIKELYYSIEAMIVGIRLRAEM